MLEAHNLDLHWLTGKYDKFDIANGEQTVVLSDNEKVGNCLPQSHLKDWLVRMHFVKLNVCVSQQIIK